MNNLIYKNATIKDLNIIVEIYNSTIESRMVTADTEPVSIESRINWFYDHNPTKRPLWIIYNTNNDVIGWVSFQSFYGRPAYIGTVEISIYLDSKHRKKGYGKEILTYCINEAPKYGINTLLGYIFAHNEPSIKLFEKFGFETWATLPNIALIDNKEYSLKILGKRIY